MQVLSHPGFRPVVHGLCALPLGYWLLQIYWALQGQPSLVRTDPGAVLANASGAWALHFLLLSLCASPLQRRLRWRWVRYRRALGLWAFTYAVLHIGVFYSLILGLQWQKMVAETLARPYIVLGLLAWLCLLPLALTSTERAMRWLQSNWQKLHYAVYPAAILAVVHQLWQVRGVDALAIANALILSLLLAERLAAAKGLGSFIFRRTRPRGRTRRSHLP